MRAFNKRHGRRGALFESRYSDRTIRGEEHYAAAVAYIEQNPIAAGLVASLDDWTWTTGNPRSPLRKGVWKWSQSGQGPVGCCRRWSVWLLLVLLVVGVGWVV